MSVKGEILEILDREEFLLRRKEINDFVSKYTVLDVYDEIREILNRRTK